MRWAEMSPEERNRLVAEQIMRGVSGPYTEDLNAAWQVVERVAGENIFLLGVHLFPHRGGCDAMFGPLQLARGTICGRTAPEATCLAALWIHGVPLEDYVFHRFR
jgi:hypothetical protein